MKRRAMLGAAGAVIVVVALTSPATSASARPVQTAGTSADPLGVYFRHDAVGANMRALAATSCGTERWPVKTATDDDRRKIHLRADDVSIKYLRNRTRPASRPQTSRVAPVELQTYRLHARLIKYVREDDSDYHLVLRDRAGRTLVVEIPSPSCVGNISPVKDAIRTARQHMDGRYSVTSSFKTASRRVIVKGVGFFDFLHGQTGMAPNGLELHPVTGLRFP